MFQRTDKIICTHRFVHVDGKRIGKKIQRKGRRAHLGSPPPLSLFNQRRKTDMSNHNKTSSGKWAFAITVSQPLLERPPFLDINQRFMDWFPHSLFNYSYFFIYLTTEDFLWGLITSLLAITFLLLVYVSFFFSRLLSFFGSNFVPLFCPRWIKAGREEKRWSYHHLQHIAACQRKVVKSHGHPIHCGRTKTISFLSIVQVFSMNMHKKKQPPQKWQALWRNHMQKANCGNLKLFPEIKPIRREIICFHLIHHAIQFDVAHVHYISFLFPTDPPEPSIHKRGGLGHLSIEIRDISYWESDWNGRLARLYHDINSNPPSTPTHPQPPLAFSTS